MLKKTITYTDFNGEERTEDFYFNLTKAECMEMNLSVAGGIEGYFQRIINAKDTPALVKEFKELILKSYGEKSADGRQMMKDEARRKAFSETEAYSILFMELATNADAAADFIKRVLPEVPEDHKISEK